MYAGGYWLLGHEGLGRGDAGTGSAAGDGSADARAVLVLFLLLGGWLVASNDRGSDPGSPESPCSTLVALGVAWFFMSGSLLYLENARYRSISHWVSWTRYSSHSLRFSST